MQQRKENVLAENNIDDLPHLRAAVRIARF